MLIESDEFGFVDFSASNASTWLGSQRTAFRFKFDSLGVVFGSTVHFF